MAIITASNGYKLRPLADGDHTFMMEVLKDCLLYTSDAADE